jgi:hypothetical protein
MKSRRPGQAAFAACLLLSIMTGQEIYAATASPSATLSQLISVANKHKLASAAGLFSSKAVLRVGKRKMSGSRSIAGWWKQEFRLGVRLTLRSRVQSRGSSAGAVLRRTTRGGDCPHGCTEQWLAVVRAGRIDQLTLQALRVPTTPRPLPTVPPAPTAPPKPGVTPTIPT